MKQINQIYVNGQFVRPHGRTVMDLINPSTRQVIGQVTLGDEKDTQDAIAAAKKAFKTFSRTGIETRSDMLQRLHDVIVKHADLLNRVAVEEYGSPVTVTAGRTQFAAQTFLLAKEILQDFEFVKQVGRSTVFMQPLGVIGAITPWNADYTHIANKLAPAIATGCTHEANTAAVPAAGK